MPHSVSYETEPRNRMNAGFLAIVSHFLISSGQAQGCPRAEDEKVVKYFKKLGNTRVLFYTRVVKYLPGGKVLSQKRKYFTRVVKFKPRRNTGFFLYFTTFGFQVGD